MTERERRRRVIEHLRSGDTSEAADELAASREVYPGDGVLHHVIGMAFASTGTLRQALDELETAAKLDPESAEILADLAQVHLARGDADKAVEAAEQSVAVEPNLALARFTLGRACFVTETIRQARRAGPPLPGERFAQIDGRTPTYLRAVEEMEAALDSTPSFSRAVRGALALAYLRAGHYHAALEQLRAQLDDTTSAEEANPVRAQIAEMAHEIARERYWSFEDTDPVEMESAAQSAAATAEQKLRLAHAYEALGQAGMLPAALAEARRAGFEARDAFVIRSNGEAQQHTRLSDANVLIAGGIECVFGDALRFFPFSSIRRISFGRPDTWRSTEVELASGERLAVVVPTLYRNSVRSPNELIQTGQFTQFSYGPGETRYAYAVGARNFISDSGIVAFSEVESLVF
jgi:tetratricopeptide (TPR) repeat protein